MLNKLKFSQPISGAVRAICEDPALAKSSGKLWALRSCITSKPRLALFTTSAQVGTTLPLLSTIDWLKLKPLRLKAIVQIPIEVSHMPTTGQVPRKKCRARELLKEAY